MCRTILSKELLAGLAFGLFVPAGAAFAQRYTGPGGGLDLGSTGGDSIRQRYNKAKNGANIADWSLRLQDADPEKRLEAVKSFGDSGDPKANDYLMQAVGDPDPRVASKAVEYLGRIRATDATLFLIQRLFMNGTSDPLRHRILMALGKIGDARASRPILEFIEGDVRDDVRGTGIYAIGEIADQSIREQLLRFRETEDDPRLKRLVDEALVKIATRQPPVAKDSNLFPTALDAALKPELLEGRH